MSTLMSKRLDFDTTILKSDTATGTVTALVNTTGIRDLQSDTMVVGCFRRVIAEQQRPALCLGHDTTRVLGRVLRMEELYPGDPRLVAARGPKADAQAGALLIEGRFNLASTDGRDAFVHVRDADLEQWSIQFTVSDEAPDGKGGRLVKEVREIFEVSPVIRAASPATATLSAKAGRVPLYDAMSDYVAGEIDKRIWAMEQRTPRYPATTSYERSDAKVRPGGQAIYEKAYQDAEIARMAGLSPYPAHKVAEQKRQEWLHLNAQLDGLRNG